MSVGGGNKIKQTMQPQVGWAKQARQAEDFKQRALQRAERFKEQLDALAAKKDRE